MISFVIHKYENMKSGQANQTNQPTTTLYASFGRVNLVRTELKATKMEADSLTASRTKNWLHEKSLSLGTLSLRAKQHLPR